MKDELKKMVQKVGGIDSGYLSAKPVGGIDSGYMSAKPLSASYSPGMTYHEQKGYGLDLKAMESDR